MSKLKGLTLVKKKNLGLISAKIKNFYRFPILECQNYSFDQNFFTDLLILILFLEKKNESK